MNLNDAINKYGILVPSDEEFYSEEYIAYFKGERPQDKERFERYRAFQEMYTKSFFATFTQKKRDGVSIANSEAVVLGGQTGAGKSALVHVAKIEFEEQGKAIFLIDDDMYRMFYPNAEEILRECPEYFTKITAIGSGSVTPKLLKYASDNGLNFIFDGTLKNPRIIDTAENWPGYSVNWKIMATCYIESALAIFERNEELRQRGKGRLIPIDAHDETYHGLEETIAVLEKRRGNDRIQVYSRGEEVFKPDLKYDSRAKKEYTTAKEALVKTRQEGRASASASEIKERISRLKKSSIPLNEKELKALADMEESIMGELDR